MLKLQKYGVGGKYYEDAETAKGDTYTCLDGSFPSTNLGCDENPYKEELTTAKYILDFGCGVGRNLPWIMENTNATYVGLDPNTTMTEFFWDVQEEQGHNINEWKNRVQIYSEFDEIPKDIKFDYNKDYNSIQNPANDQDRNEKKFEESKNFHSLQKPSNTTDKNDIKI